MISKNKDSKYKVDTGLRTRPYHDDKLPFPKFEKPNPIGFFSVSTERDYEPTARHLQYFKIPKNLPLDLNKGLSIAIKRTESSYDERIDHLLHFIVDHKDELMSTQEMPSNKPRICAEFICYRGLLRVLMSTPYEFRQDWCIHVTKFNGSYYLVKRDSEFDKFQRANETQECKNMCAWGYKFEQYCSSDSPLIEPDTSVPVDENAEFSCVFKTRLNGMELLYGAEMDGIVSEQPVFLHENSSLRDLKFIELKTSLADLNPRQQQSYCRYKTRNWWCQSFLVGIQDIYVGLRTEKGFVKKIEHVEVRSLPKQGVNYWTPKACANFLIQFLSKLREVMANENCPYTTYEFYYNSSSSRITYECLRGKTEHSFLPDWYIDMFQRPNNPK